MITLRGMKFPRRLLLIAFVESFATICVERGIFFYAHLHLGFSESLNLWLSLSFGVAYVAGALLSHPIAARIGEKRLLCASVLGQLIVHLLLAVFGSHASWLFVLNALIGMLNGLKWPVVESYVSAGRDAGGHAINIGNFNLAWASAVPLSLLLTGPLNTGWPQGLFLVPAVFNAVALLLMMPLPPVPQHLDEAHPTRPRAREMLALTRLLVSSRWLLLLSYACMWLLSALIPSIFARLGVAPSLAPGLSGLLDVFRVAAFLGFRLYRGWIGSARFLAVQCAAVPVSFLLILLGSNLATVLVGEVAFGLAAGGVYYAAIYYAMVVKNASVDAGGGHEALIGSGFVLGPSVGLFAIWMTPRLGSQLLGALCGVGPLIVIAVAAALIPLWRHADTRNSDESRD